MWWRAARCGLALVAISLCATLPYLNSLEGKYAYDDKVAVAGNPDVYRKNVSWSDILRHDFWGNDMLTERTHGWTHHSWRPLVVLSFRWDHVRGGGSVVPFHVSNVLIHAASSLAAFALYLVLLPPAASGRALLAAIIFAMHSVHNECVANITSRADPLASVFQFLALALYIWASGRVLPALARARGTPPWTSRAAWCGCFASCAALRAALAACALQLACAVLFCALLLAALASKETSLVVPFLCIVYDIAVAMARAAIFEAPREEEEGGSGARLPDGGAVQPPDRGAAPAPRPRALWVATYLHNLLVRDLPWLKCAAMFAFGFAVYYVRIVIVARGYTLASWANPLHNSLYHTHEPIEKLLSIAFVQAFAMSLLVLPWHLSHEHNALRHVLSIADPRNAITALVWVVIAATAALALRDLYRAAPRGGGGARRAALEAPLKAPAPQSAGEASAGADIDAAAAELEAADAAADASLLRAFILLFSLGWTAVSYFPSSHVLQYVAFVLAERTLYLPSFGAALFLAEALMLAAGLPVPLGAPLLSGGERAAEPKSAGAPAEPPSPPLDAGSGSPPRAQPTRPKHVQFVFVQGHRIALPRAADKSAPPLAHPPEHDLRGGGSAGAHTRSAPAAGSAAARAGCAAFIVRAPCCRSRRRGAASAAGASLLCLYGALTRARNGAWVNEEALMSANIAMYPDHNIMTVYGLGAVALYKGEINAAEALLARACNESTMVEPHILLSQLYWKHRSSWPNASDVAIGELQHVAATVTPRKEVLTNLGMLLFNRALTPGMRANRSAALKEAEYYVLAAQIAHGYPEGHHALAQLASNAACIRLMSPAERYGDAVAAERLIADALAGARGAGGTAASYRNAATFYAVQGYPLHAISLLEEGIGVITGSLADARAASDPVWPGSRDAVIVYYVDMLNSLTRLLLSVQVHTPLIASWAASSAPVIGEQAEERMAILGLECTLELLWW